jgi:predicted deacetylase
MLPARPPPPPPALCVSIHDVAPATWRDCAQLLEALAPLAPLPLTLLVVPDYHGGGAALPAWYRHALERRLELGDELALHGWRHLDEGPPPAGWAERARRRLYTAGEGEFAAVPAATAERLLKAGRAWFAAQGWPLAGFVAPAWLLGPGAWAALAEPPPGVPRFAYTTTLNGFHALAPRRSVAAPCLVYSTRSGLRRAASLAWNALPRGRSAPLLRLALHPADARHPALLRQAVSRLETLLAEREAMTKAQFAARLG